MYQASSIIISIVFYIVSAVSLFFMAKKANVRKPWISFIPVLQIIIMLHIIDKSGWAIFWLLVPGLNIILGIIWTVKLYMAFDLNIGLIVASIIIPFVSLAVMLIIAFSDKYTYVKTNRFAA